MDKSKMRASTNIEDRRGKRSQEQWLDDVGEAEINRERHLKKFPDWEKNDQKYEARKSINRQARRNRDLREPTAVENWGNAGAKPFNPKTNAMKKAPEPTGTFEFFKHTQKGLK